MQTVSSNDSSQLRLCVSLRRRIHVLWRIIGGLGHLNSFMYLFNFFIVVFAARREQALRTLKMGYSLVDVIKNYGASLCT